MSWASLVANSRKAAHRLLGGVSVTAGAVSGTGLFDQRSELVMSDQVIALELALTVETAVFGHLTYGETLTVAGNQYTVRQEPMLIGEGLDCVILLSAVDT